MANASIDVAAIAISLLGGAVRGSIPYIFVSLGECLTEKSGRINLGMEGILLMGAMSAFLDRLGAAAIVVRPDRYTWRAVGTRDLAG